MPENQAQGHEHDDAQWINSVPHWYGPEWPDDRRCTQGLRLRPRGKDRNAPGYVCGYPTAPGHDRCVFHREGEKSSDLVREELALAVAAGTCLHGAHLSGADLMDMNLAGAELSEADLSGAKLTFSDLSRAHLHGANLSNASFYGGVLSGARLIDANLRGADLSHTKLNGAKLRYAHLEGAKLYYTRFGGRADLRGARLDGASFVGATFSREARLDGVVWWPEDTRGWWRRMLQIGEPMFTDQGQATTGHGLTTAERTCRDVKKAYQGSGHYDLAGTFFVREMECRRKRLPWYSSWVYNVLHFVSDYFESPWRVVVIGLLVILLFAFLHAGMGFVWATGKNVPEGGQDIGGTALTLNPLAADWATMGRGLYFSAITFTATGYGDYVPAEGWGQFVAALESLVGVFLMAMFLVCLARKFGRA